MKLFINNVELQLNVCTFYISPSLFRELKFKSYNLYVSFSQVVYHSDYEKNVRGKVTSSTNTVELDRASNANKIRSDVSVSLYCSCTIERCKRVPTSSHLKRNLHMNKKYTALRLKFSITVSSKISQIRFG